MTTEVNKDLKEEADHAEWRQRPVGERKRCR
jgi:hypothetical protein